MTWTEKSKNASRFTRVVKSNVTRGSFPSTAQTRGDIATDIRGSASGKVSRKEMEDKYGTREDNNSFTGLTKNAVSHNEVTKNDSSPSEVTKNTANWEEVS